MKQIATIGFVASFLVFFPFKALLYAISVTDYTFTNDHYSIECIKPLPAPIKNFDAAYDEEMCIKLYVENVSPGDTVQFKWYLEGVLVGVSDVITYSDSDVHCPWNCTDLRNPDVKYDTGYISIEVYLNGMFDMRDGFYVQGLPPPTTTSVNPTTTTSIDNGCPPDYPIDCGNGWCCPLDLPVCGRGIYITWCFEKGTNPNCPVATLYGEDSYEVEQLRYFRDNVLSKTHEGRELIKLYYQWSPVIVRAMKADEEFKKEIKQTVDVILPMIEGALE